MFLAHKRTQIYARGLVELRVKSIRLLVWKSAQTLVDLSFKCRAGLSCNCTKETSERVSLCQIKVSVKANPVILFLVPLHLFVSCRSSFSSSSSSHLALWIWAASMSGSPLFSPSLFRSVKKNFFILRATTAVIPSPQRVSASSRERKWCVRMRLYPPVIWSDVRLR